MLPLQVGAGCWRVCLCVSAPLCPLSERRAADAELHGNEGNSRRTGPALFFLPTMPSLGNCSSTHFSPSPLLPSPLFLFFPHSVTVSTHVFITNDRHGWRRLCWLKMSYRLDRTTDKNRFASYANYRVYETIATNLAVVSKYFIFSEKSKINS